MTDPTTNLEWLAPLPPGHTPALLNEWRNTVFNEDTLLSYAEWLEACRPREWLVTVKVTLERRIILEASCALEARQTVLNDPSLIGLDLPGLPDGIDILDSDWTIEAHEA